MTLYLCRFTLRLAGWILLLLCAPSSDTTAAPWDPAAVDYAGRKAVTLYVSKQGDNSDGSSWQKGFHTIQAALLAVPDDQGGHRIVVRPDTYLEANLYTLHKGAAGSYNLLIGDCDGSLGSGAVGRVVIDSGDPEGKGFKSFDWWSTIRATTKGWSPEHTDATFSSISWDRWILRNLYATGGDAGLFWDLTNQSGSGFTVVVEDCVGIGRAFGGGFGYPVVRETEPIVFRRCLLMSLDWWGDAGGLAVGVPARVVVESRPDRDFAATVDAVDALAKPRVSWVPVQYFGVTLALERTDPGVMKPGQRVRAVLTLDGRKDAIAVPREAVFEKDGKKIVHRRSGWGFEPVEVVLGPVAIGRVVIDKGLSPGDVVALRDPERPAGAAAPPGGGTENAMPAPGASR